VLRYLRPYWRLAAFSVALIVLGALAGLLAPWPLQILFDNVLGDRPLPAALAFVLGPVAQQRSALLLFAVVGGVVVTLLQQGLTVLDNYVNTKIDQRMILDFRSDLFRHAQRLSLAYHDQRRSGMLIYAINSQADAAARLVVLIPPLAQSVLTLLGMFGVLLLLNWQLALLALTVVPFLYWSVGYYMKHIQQRLYEVRAMEGESLSIIHEAISMLRVIVAFGREDHEHRRFRTQGERTVDARVQVTVRQTLFSLAVNTITAVGTALVLGFGAYQVLEGRLSPGQLLVVLSYIALVYKPLETISTTVGSFQELFVSLKVAFDLLDTEPEIKDEPGALDLPRARGDVRFENVSFHYTGRVGTLQEVTFEARAGQVIAIVGPTGAGKSTLVSLIPRMYDARQGRILLDGTDVRRLTLRSLRSQVSIVLQEPLLFSGTIAENIRYGRLEASMDEVIEAARAANAHDFIVRLPGQYDTELGERGAKLSGGERQRIAVARAFLKDAPVLILDEPTSSIDSRTEAVILDALDRLMVGRTTFLIAHRLSTVRRADAILVIDQGRLVECGTHQELLRLGGLYRQLHDVQTRQALRRAPADLEAVGDGNGEGRA
jgi:ATP-binding cassette subfamily B protein/subfamily B ATP-binding cassette protein MsbA